MLFDVFVDIFLEFEDIVWWIKGVDLVLLEWLFFEEVVLVCYGNLFSFVLVVWIVFDEVWLEEVIE